MMPSGRRDAGRSLSSFQRQPASAKDAPISCMKRRRPGELSGLFSSGVANSRDTNSWNSGSPSSSDKLRQYVGWGVTEEGLWSESLRVSEPESHSVFTL